MGIAHPKQPKTDQAKAYEGHELFINELRMSLKAYENAIKWTFLFCFIGTFVFYLYKFSFSYLCLDIKYLIAQLLFYLNKHLHNHVIWKFLYSKIHFSLGKYSFTPDDYVFYYTRYIAPITSKFWKIVLVLNISALFVGPFVWIYFFKRKSKKDLHTPTYLRGAKLLKPKEVNKQLKERYGKARIKLTKHIALPEKLESRGIFILGTVGTGKSTLIKSILSSLRNEDDIAVIFDVIFDLKGEYLSAFYDKTRDLIFNPLDSRSVVWNLFRDIKYVLEVQDTASTFIPVIQGQNVYFYEAARRLFAAILEILYRKNEWDYNTLYQTLTLPPAELLAFLEENRHLGGGQAIADISKPDSTQTQGVISQMLNYTQVFRLLQDVKAEDRISIRDWVREAKGSWLFLPIPAQFSNLLKPIHTALINMLMTEVLSFKNYPGRKTWFILDELGSLLQIPKLNELADTGRSKGVCIVIGTQTIAKLDAVYSPPNRKDLLNVINTKILLRVACPETAQYCEELLGQQEWEELKKSHSFGVDDVRDGLNFSKQDMIKPIVLASEFMQLPDLTAYVKIAELPPALDKIPFKKFEEKIESFILREIREIAPQTEKARRTEKELLKDKETLSQEEARKEDKKGKEIKISQEQEELQEEVSKDKEEEFGY